MAPQIARPTSAGGASPRSFPNSARFIFQQTAGYPPSPRRLSARTSNCGRCRARRSDRFQHAGRHHSGPGNVNLVQNHEGIDPLGHLAERGS